MPFELPEPSTPFARIPDASRPPISPRRTPICELGLDLAAGRVEDGDDAQPLILIIIQRLSSSRTGSVFLTP